MTKAQNKIAIIYGKYSLEKTEIKNFKPFSLLSTELVITNPLINANNGTAIPLYALPKRSGDGLKAKL